MAIALRRAGWGAPRLYPVGKGSQCTIWSFRRLLRYAVGRATESTPADKRYDLDSCVGFQCSCVPASSTDDLAVQFHRNPGGIRPEFGQQFGHGSGGRKMWFAVQNQSLSTGCSRREHREREGRGLTPPFPGHYSRDRAFPTVTCQTALRSNTFPCCYRSSLPWRLPSA